VVAELACTAKPAILCVQETKLQDISANIAREIAGPNRGNVLFLPADGTRGGVAIFWDDSIVTLSNQDILRFSVSATVTILRTGTSFLLSSVYGPADDERKPDFLQEMTALRPVNSQHWLIAGDFNLIYEARDKNNTTLNRRLMGQFRAAINLAELK
jgi:exonuclease III